MSTHLIQSIVSHCRIQSALSPMRKWHWGSFFGRSEMTICELLNLIYVQMKHAEAILEPKWSNFVSQNNSYGKWAPEQTAGVIL